MLVVLYILVAFAFLSYVGSVAFVYLNSAEFKELFFNTNLEVDQKYFQYFTPHAIVFTVIWPVVYLWNVTGILYIVAGAFLPPRMSPVKISPTITPAPFLFTYGITFLMTIGWVFAYDAEILPLSFAFLAAGTLTCYICVGISYKNIHDNLLELEIKGNMMMWMIRIFVQNGLAIVASWLTFSMITNATNLLIFRDSFYNVSAIERGIVTQEVGSLIGLGILFVFIIVWFILENFVWEKYCRYTFTIYPVFILALAGLIFKLTENIRENIDVNRVLILASVELGVCSIAFLVRIGLFVYKVRARASLTAA